MNIRSIRSFLLAATVALLSSPALATISISTQPLFVTTAVPPNILVVLDDSGSMASAFVPDSLDDSTSLIVKDTIPVTAGTTVVNTTVIVTAGSITNGTVTVTNNSTSASVIVATGSLTFGTVTSTSAPISGTVQIATGVVNHVPVHITGPSGGKYTYSCTTSGYVLNPSSPTKGTSSTAAGYSCDQQTYDYSCASGYNLNPSSPTNGTSSTASGYTCSKPNYTYSCSSGFTLVGSGSGSTSTPPSGTKCQQQTYDYSCPSGYTLNPSSPTSGTSSTASGYTCTNPAYTYSCSTGFTLVGASTGTTSTPPSGTKCQQQNYTYSCPSGYTLSGSSTGTANPAPSSTTCGQSVPTYTCPSGWTQNGSGSTSTCSNYVTKSVQGEDSVMFKSAAYNPLAYDPTITYSAPFKADGTLYSTSFTTAYINGYDTSRGNVNLSTSYRAVVSYNPSSTSQTTNDCIGTFTGSTANGSVSCESSMGGVAAYYYTYNASNSGCTSVITDSRCYTKVVVSSTSGPGSTDEQQNFANWFSFYKTRNLTTVSSADRAFAQLNSTMRVGWINLGSCTAFASTGCAGWTSTQYDNRIAQFTGTHRSDFFNWLSRFPANVSTPLRTALNTAGAYYKTSGVNSPYAQQPQVTDGTEYVCRPNYTVLMTDGLWNSDSISSFGNTDKTAATLPDGTSYTTTIKPYFDSSSNSLADIAFYYWKTNLRSDLGTTAALQYMPYNKNVTVTDSVNGTASLIPYWNPQNDPASWPHMNTFTVGLGMTTTITSPKWGGSTFAGTGYGDLVTGHVTWPSVSSDSANNIYDLWHAAINSRAQFFSADSPQDVAAAFNSIVSRITGRVGSSSAIAVNSTRLDSNTFIYQAQFNSGDWSGEVLAYKINTDGSIGAVQWQATQKLAATAYTSRNILSWDDTANSNAGAGISFAYASLNTAEKAALDKNISGVTDSKGTERVAYLSGDQSKEQSQSGGIYRNRALILGDIVNSNPLFVGTQNFGFGNLPGAEGSSYSAFVANKASRTQALVVGGNDGMLHAFNANTGDELFAYVPRGIYGNLSALTDPLYTHQFYVDGSPQSVDAYVSGSWKTLMAATTGAGGREIFLIDVSSPSAVTTSSIMWDYDGVVKSDNDMGYTIGQPTIARMHDGDWYVIFGNGYNSPNQHAVLYLYNIRTKAITKFDTGVGTDNGMSSPNPVDFGGDRIADAIYAGDLKGNLWKLDVSDPSPSNWKYMIYAASGSTPNPLFTAKDASNNVQPITDRPQVGLNNSGQVMVFFGTGTYFQTGDNAVPNTPPVMSFYGLIDDKGNAAADQVLKANLVQQTVLTETTVNGTNLRVTSSNPLTTGSQGWYINLDYPNAQGERVVSDAVLDNGRVIFTTVIPQGTACQYGGISWLMELDINTGSRLTVSPFDINGDGKVNNNDYVTVTYTDPVTHASTTVTVPVSGKQSNVGIIKTPGIISAGSLEYKYYSGSTGAIGMTVESAGYAGGRLSWQQVQ